MDLSKEILKKPNKFSEPQLFKLKYTKRQLILGLYSILNPLSEFTQTKKEGYHVYIGIYQEIPKSLFSLYGATHITPNTSFYVNNVVTTMIKYTRLGI